MSRRLVCGACGVGRFEDATDKAKVHSNVRRWRAHVSTVWRCPSCRSLTSLEVLDLGPFYTDYPYGKRQLDGFTRRVFSSYLARLKRHGVRPGATVLDYGCGDGLLLGYLSTQGLREVAGYDAFSARYADRSVLTRQYDLVIAQDVVEHVEDPGALIELLAKCTRPGGLLCIGTPRADDIDLAYTRRSIHSLHQPYHLHILSERALQDLARRAGLTVAALDRRHSCDTPYPFVNWRFLRAYLAAGDDTLDAGFDPPKPSTFFRSPQLVVQGLLGYLAPTESEMIAILRRPTES